MTKVLYRVYQYLIALPILVCATIITALLTLIGSPIFSHQWWGYYPPRIWSKLWCILFFVKVKVVGRENIEENASYVFVANHQGAFDIFAIYGYLNHNFKWMMKKSLQNIPFVGVACIAAGHILVDKSSAAAVAKTMQTARKRLADGMSLVIFPEGSRSSDGKLQPFKRGAFKLATDFNRPIVPVTINGSFGIMSKKSRIINPGTITLTIHKPIDSSADIEQTLTQSYEAIKSALPEGSSQQN